MHKLGSVVYILHDNRVRVARVMATVDYQAADNLGERNGLLSGHSPGGEAVCMSARGVWYYLDVLEAPVQRLWYSPARPIAASKEELLKQL